MNREIHNPISRHEEIDAFTKIAPTREMLNAAEEKLGFPIPGQFLEYINTYSHGGFGFEIIGIGFDGSINFLDETLEYRKEGLPDNLLVVENCDEWLYCIDADTGEVASWHMGREPQVDYPCFDDFLIDRLKGSIENL